MGIYKPIKKNDFNLDRFRLHKKFILNSGSYGISSFQFRSGSTGLSGSYYDSLRTNFYLSGSSLAQGFDKGKFNSPYHSFGLYDPHNPQHKNKFHSSGSVISITQKYFGEKIKEGSFELTDKSSNNLTANTHIIIKDDTHGNLYSTNAKHSQSSATAISSSDNYVGNIFYNLGIVTLTETGSWSGSVNYTDVGTDDFNIQFGSTQTLYTNEYAIKIKGNQLNGTSNPTATSGSHGYLIPGLISGKKVWGPYITTVGLYDNNNHLLVVGRLSQPVKKIDWGDITFKVRFDI
jgi:hypothetical protein